MTMDDSLNKQINIPTINIIKEGIGVIKNFPLIIAGDIDWLKKGHEATLFQLKLLQNGNSN